MAVELSVPEETGYEASRADRGESRRDAGQARNSRDSGSGGADSAQDQRGATEKDLLASYPHLTRDDIRGAVAFAADTIAYEEIVETAAHTD